jgi:hypothetical protein
MTKVKIFQGSSGNTLGIEREINGWLEEMNHKIDIVSTNVSTDNCVITALFVYEERGEQGPYRDSAKPG